MAAGKTSIGRRVARELGIPFIDSDARIVHEHGPISEIFAQLGEPAFRAIEETMIAAELDEPGAKILALGGGAVLSAATRNLLRAHSVILLMTTERAVKRTANLAKRPLLRDDPGAWSRILQERRPLYETVAEVTFRTDRASKDQLVRRITAWILHPEARGTEDERVDE
jgi:shikimate kinase